MKKRLYLNFLIIAVCFGVFTGLMTTKASSNDNTIKTEEFTGTIKYDENVASDNPDIDWDTYVPTDAKNHSLSLDKNYRCEINIQCISGKGYVRYSIGKGEFEESSCYDIYLSPSGCENNESIIELKKGEYDLQIALEEYSEVDAQIEYRVLIKYIPLNDDEMSQITISDSSLELASGDTRWLKLLEDGYEIGSYDEEELLDISWKSSNKKVATIDKYGELTPRKPGTCTITATYYGEKYECNVTVLKTKFSIVNKNISLNFGGRKEVKFKASPKLKSLFIFPESYTTSNKNVAVFDFDENEVVAKGKGSCKITFTFYNGQKATCTVKVGTPTLKQQLESQVVYAIDDLIIEYNKKTKEYLADIYINNESNNNITYVEFGVYQYDNKGTRINKGNSSFIYNGTINANDLKIVYCSVHANTRKVHACVKKVYYQNGKTWTNPLYSNWNKKYANKF